MTHNITEASIHHKGKVAQRLEYQLSRLQRPSVLCIADYGHTGDLAFSEVHNSFNYAFNGSRRLERGVELLFPIAVPPFSTLATGITIEQQALYQKVKTKKFNIFSNTAPRGIDAEGGETIEWKGQAEQAFVLAELDNGVCVFAVNAGWNLAFIKDRIVRLRKINVSNTNTQFRSRDQYAPSTRLILQGGIQAEALLGEDLDINENIPDRPNNKIGYLDGYGNIKSTMTLQQLQAIAINQGIDLLHDEFINVEIDGITHRVSNNFAEDSSPTTGELFITTGSSGNPRNPYIEFISMRGRAEDTNTASQQFDVRGQRDDRGNIKILKYDASATYQGSLLISSKHAA